MTLLLLLWAFIQIGLLAFGGGYATLPLIQQVIVTKYHWLSLREMTDIITLSQLTPGPIAINSASFVGTKIGGIAGAIVATLGNTLPQLIIILLLSHFWFGGKRIIFIDKMLKGLRPGVVGLIAAAGITIFTSAIFPQGWQQPDMIAGAGFLLGTILLISPPKFNVITLILLGAILGVGLEAYTLLVN